MKKISVLFAALLMTLSMSAASYGILVNGRYYFAADYKGPDAMGEGFEEYLAHVKVQAGDYCQMYDADNKAAWAKPLNSYSEAGFTYDATNQRYNVTVTGCYDFYIKLKYNADELYIGPAGTGVVCTDGQDIDAGPIDPGYSGAAPAQCPDVMLQAFYYESTTDKGHGRTKWIDHLNGANGSSAEEIGKWFDLVWLPPMSKSEGGMGYHPVNYGNLDSDWGTNTKLKQLIGTLHENGARVVADIVINHAGAQEGWCNFKSYSFGTYGTFTPDGDYICNTDEMNTKAPTSACRGYATGNADDGYGSEANYESARDWDHTNPDVQNMFKAYLNWLRNEIKVDGFRYDYCKGFNNSHINDYNSASKAYFSVMEYWDGDLGTLQYHLNEAGKNTTTFDFNMKYNAFNAGIASDNYCALKGAGLPGAGWARYAVSFVDSHDTYQRGSDSEFCGNGNSMTVCPDKIKQCYAYMLSMPGVPCVFWPHWVTFKDAIKPMINARYKTGVHSESSVSDECGNGYYKATITGKNGEIRLLLGPNSGYNSTPSGYTLAGKGVNYGVYYKVNSARGDKDTERTPIGQGIEDVKSQNAKVRGEKFIQNGQLFIRVEGKTYDVQGRLVK